MVLNCFYYIYVKGDPSLAGRFDINNEASVDVFIVPIIVTICLLGAYYVQYAISISMGCVRMCDKEIPRARKIGFLMGFVVQVFFIMCALFGVFECVVMGSLVGWIDCRPRCRDVDPIKFLGDAIFHANKLEYLESLASCFESSDGANGGCGVFLSVGCGL